MGKGTKVTWGKARNPQRLRSDDFFRWLSDGTVPQTRPIVEEKRYGIASEDLLGRSGNSMAAKNSVSN